MGQILAGTCSWTDPTLIESGRFYPQSVKSAEDRLKYYASQFPLVEVDSTYYSMPAERTARLWVERTEANFIFDVKAFRLFTHHPTPLSALPKDIRQEVPAESTQKANLYLKDMPPELTEELWQRFERALLPLDSAGKLGVVLFQFPPWFPPARGNKEYILQLKERLPQYRVAIEFRAASWFEEARREDTVSLLRDNGFPLVCVDAPQGFRSSVPPLAEATSDIALVRFHGRNRETWEKKGLTPAERFNYLYSKEELGEWVPKIKELASKAQQVHVLFNNCYHDKAVVNARQIKLMLD